MRAFGCVLFAAVMLVLLSEGICVPSNGNTVQVTWLGHACFRLVPSSGPIVVTDPFPPNVGAYPQRKPKADVVTISHEHFDHNATDQVTGPFTVVRGSATREVKGVSFRGVATYHDTSRGSQRGPNTVFVFRLDAITFCHLGDLGHVLTPEQVRAIGPVDVLMIPVGGYYTIDGKTAQRVVQQLKPKVVFPMHYKTKLLSPSNPISGVASFLEGQPRVRRLKGDTISLTAGHLPSETTIYVFERYG
ncbi:MAG: MBL fold metallo-hydrolase [Armatimonadota bacterium]